MSGRGVEFVEAWYKTYVEALAPFRLDPREKSFWAAGVSRLKRLVDEFEALG